MKHRPPDLLASRKLNPQDYEFGMVAYQAFIRSRTRSLIAAEDGFAAEFAEWQELEQSLRAAWAWAAHAVRTKVFEEME